MMKNMFVALFLLGGIWCNSYLQAQTVRPVAYYPMLNWDTSPYKSYRYTRENAAWEWINFRLLFPNDYDSTAVDGDEYPIIVMLHGAGESGRLEWKSPVKQNNPYPTDDPRRDNNDHHLLFGGREHLAAVKSGRFPGFVLFPQNSYASWVQGKGDASSEFHADLEKAVELIEYLVNHLKIDPARIYIHGISAGGLGTWLAAYKRPDLFAAALPMSAPGDPAMADQLQQLPLWVFQGELDTNPRPWLTRQTVDAVVAAGGEVRYTEYEGEGHNTWNIAYQEDDFFEWMLRQRKGNTNAPNQPPRVNAGVDKSIVLPASSSSFTATASDPDGTIASYRWEKVSGPAATMSGANTATLSLSGLVEGTYTFRVSIEDDKGAMATDEVVLVVNPAANQVPVVNAGADKIITLPTNTANFTATASDPDGTIASYLWEKVSGPEEVNIVNPSSQTVTLNGLVQGVYVFKVRVIDNSGASATDEVRLTVNARPNQGPVVDAGADKTITLPANTASFTATATDPDGNIASYLWEKLSGPAATLSGASTATLSLSALVEGTYTFKITVTDNAGTSASDQVQLKVNPRPNQSPVVDAGVDKTITLPTQGATFTANASDPDGTVSAYAWEKISGPGVTLTGANTATLSLSGLTAGTYVFKVKVTDNKGATASDEVQLIVRPEPNKAPIVDAGEDKSITLPVNAITITAAASDPDGTISSYLWEKVSGPAATLEGVNSASLSLSNLVHGSYTFKVSVTDNKGSTSSDNVIVRVFAEVQEENQSPVASVGGDTTVYLPLDFLVLEGIAADADGTIESYLWEKISGPEVRMGYADSTHMELAALEEGVYVFRFTATDNAGATASAELTLKVEYLVNAVQPSAAAFSTIAFPNPFEQSISVKVKSFQQEEIRVSLYDMLSSLIYQGSFKTIPGEVVEHHLTLPSGMEQGGIYFVQLENQEGTYREVLRVVKK